MINAISAADITFVMSSSTSAWLLSPLECSPQMAESFASVFEDELCEKCIIKQLLNSVFAWYHELSKPDLGFDNSRYHAQPHPIIDDDDDDDDDDDYYYYYYYYCHYYMINIHIDLPVYTKKRSVPRIVIWVTVDF